jgi:hypothetical protein
VGRNRAAPIRAVLLVPDFLDGLDDQDQVAVQRAIHALADAAVLGLTLRAHLARVVANPLHVLPDVVADRTTQRSQKHAEGATSTRAGDGLRTPRALWVPFPYGYPLGRDGDPALQTRVIEAALALVENPAAEPPVLADLRMDG